MIEAVPLRFGIPEPPARPGDVADFSYLVVPPAGSVPRPEIENISSTGIRNGLSTSRAGIGM